MDSAHCPLRRGFVFVHSRLTLVFLASFPSQSRNVSDDIFQKAVGNLTISLHFVPGEFSSMV